MLTTIRECREAARELASRCKEGREARWKYFETMKKRFREMSSDERARIRLDNLFESFVEDGDEIIREIRANGQNVIYETVGPVGTANFRYIVGQFTFAEVLEAYNQPAFIADQLVTTVPATTQFQEIVPGITRIGNIAEAVGEGESYPRVQLSGTFVTAPAATKKGFIIEFTEEMLREDKTGQLLERARMASTDLGIERERTLLSMCTGASGFNTYSRNGSATMNTYDDNSGVHNWDNTQSNTLDDVGCLENAELLLSAVTDPDTNDPIMLGSNRQILVPLELYRLASLLVAPVTVQLGSTTSATIPVQQGLPSPVGITAAYGTSGMPTVHSNVFVKAVTSSATSWFYGDFKRAFFYREIVPLQLSEMPSSNDAAFDRDVVAGFKVRRFGAPFVKEPRFVNKNT